MELEVFVKQNRIITESFETTITVPDDFNKEEDDLPDDWVAQIDKNVYIGRYYLYKKAGEKIDLRDITII